MRKVLYLTLALAAVAALAAGSLALAGAGKKNVEADALSGYMEGSPGGPISTTGHGTFEATIDDAAEELHYTLTYADLEGDVLQSHIHFGHRDVNGSISVFLCTNLGNGPAGTPACPPPPATVTGTITAADVTSLAAGQGIGAGEFDELVAAIRAGKTYANVHSSTWPGGEIRAQINDDDQRE
jgi:CHRD domain